MELFAESRFPPNYRKLQVVSLGYIGLLESCYKVYRPSIRLL